MCINIFPFGKLARDFVNLQMCVVFLFSFVFFFSNMVVLAVFHYILECCTIFTIENRKTGPEFSSFLEYSPHHTHEEFNSGT